MHLVNLALCQSKVVADKEQRKASLQLDKRQRQLEQRQHDKVVEAEADEATAAENE